jgi:hypothetical protein
VIAPPKQARKAVNTLKRHYSQVGQDALVDELLQRRRNGFFFECGAHDGEELSNTLFFERERGWTGLLIEANPKSFKQLEERNRTAYISNACLSTTPYANTINFTFANALGGLDKTGHSPAITSIEPRSCSSRASASFYTLFFSVSCTQ